MSRASPFLDNIAGVATRVVAECESKHQARVSQLLASYIVRSLSFQDPVRYDLSQPLVASDVAELVQVCLRV